MLERRRVLAGGLAGIAAAGTGAWRYQPGSVGRLAGVRVPGSLPYPSLPAGTDTIPQVEHIVVLMMENHSYDNRLGMLRRRGANGFRLGRDGKPTAASRYANGDVQHAFRMPTTCQISTVSQNWHSSHVQYDNGKMDGFVIASGPESMGYWQAEDQPFYYSLARIFPISDAYHASVLGQTYPNRRYLLAATSIGQVNDTLPGQSDYPPNGTIFDLLDAHGVSWKDYYSSLPSAFLYPRLYVKNNGTKVVPIGDFFKDAASGRLPGYCLVEPDYGQQSEENPQNVAEGEAFAAKVINALMHGPAWDRTLLIWTYDEHGGWYDHVPPPAAIAPDSIPPAGVTRYDGFSRLGFRVPFAIVSPWARRNYVSHVVRDHTSILKLVETKWNLPALTYRDANASAPLDMLDLRRPSFTSPPALARPLLATTPSARACDRKGAGVIPSPGSVTKRR
ncbi:MAG TPA: alkaline phosphatase family protein [Streptosporangiaceae bacterium]|nr:alkaline phosphatase family protein [Streptosporangiaceae bacterium]